MNKAGAIVVLAIVGVAIAVIVLRWPRIDPGMVLVVRSQAASDVMEIEYRMREPFHVSLEHEIRERLETPSGTGIYVSPYKPLRSEHAATFPSAYDFLRGEHYVRLRVVAIKGGGLQAPRLPQDIYVHYRGACPFSGGPVAYSAAEFGGITSATAAGAAAATAWLAVT